RCAAPTTPTRSMLVWSTAPPAKPPEGNCPATGSTSDPDHQRPRSMDAERLQIVVTHCHHGELAIREYRDLRAVGGMDGIPGLAVADGAFDISDVLNAEERQLFYRHVSNSLALVHRILSTLLGARSGVSARVLLEGRCEPPVISIVR